MGRKGKLRARPRAASQPIVWRSGVHIVGTSIWCDARRARELCFVSRADRVSPSRHGQVIATRETLALLSRSQESADDASELAVPLGRPFSLGTLRLELFASGSAVGAASLSVELGCRRVVYAGSVNPRGGGLGGAADQRTCDVLVIEANHGQPGAVFLSPPDAAAEVADRCRRITAAGGAAVLLVDGVLEGLDLADRLDHAGLRSGVELVAHRSINEAAERLGAVGVRLSPLRVAARRPRPGQVVLWPVSRRVAFPPEALPRASEVLLVSGAAISADAVGRAGAAHGVAWSTQADHIALRRYVEESGATEVYVTGRLAETLAADLSRDGRPVRPLGPPVQMSLFA